MTSTTRRLDGPALLAAIGLIFADGAVAEAHPAASASAAPPPASAPPTGHHAPPPPGAERRGRSTTIRPSGMIETTPSDMRNGPLKTASINAPMRWQARLEGATLQAAGD